MEQSCSLFRTLIDLILQVLVGEAALPPPISSFSPSTGSTVTSRDLLGVTGTTLTFTLHCLLKGTFVFPEPVYMEAGGCGGSGRLWSDVHFCLTLLLV